MSTPNTTFQFIMSDQEAAEALKKIPTSEREFIRLVERCAIYGVQKAILMNGAVYLTQVYDGLSPKFQNPFKAWLLQYAPVTFDKEVNRFKLSQSKLLDMAGKWNVPLTFDKNGTCQTPENLKVAAGVIRSRMELENVNWAKPAQGGTGKDKKEYTQADLDKAIERLAKKAESTGLLMPESSPHITSIQDIINLLQHVVLSEDEMSVVEVMLNTATAKLESLAVLKPAA